MKQKTNIPLEELRATVPAFIGGNLVLLAGCAIYGIFCGFDWRMFTGIIAGNIISAANFYLMGRSVERTIKRRNAKKAQFHANASYAVRYLGMFAALAVLLALKVVLIVPAVVPLFFPRIYYFINALRHKPEDENQ